MRLWKKNNRLDADLQLEPAQVAQRVKASSYRSTPRPRQRSLHASMSDSDGGPVSAVWDEEAGVVDLLRLVRASRWAYPASQS
jgi:hypothetical protein